MLAINLGTRGRPELLIQTVERTLANIVREDTVLMVSVDDDDRETIKALAARGWANGAGAAGGIVTSVAPREDSLGAKFNRVLEYVPEADVYLAAVDYAPHITPGFDQKILDAANLFPDGIGVVYNRLANATFPQINAVTRKWCDLTGYFYPPYFPYWFIDHWLDDVARITDRIAFADVEIDVSARPGTQGLRDLAFWSEFFARLYPERRRQAHEIIKVLDEPDWRKHILFSHHPLIEARSLWVSQTVTAGAIETERAMGAQDTPEARYLRVRAAAEAMMGMRSEAA